MINSIEMIFKDGFKGVLNTPKSQVDIGTTKDAIAPYDMLFGALGACLYATFYDIAKKKRINYSETKVYVSGEKRKTTPQTLKNVLVIFEVYDAKDEDGINKSIELAKKYCSVYHTIGAVAEITCKVQFF